MGQNAAVTERTVAVLAGGLSHEREVSLRSGRRLAAALRETGTSVREWDVDAALVERLRTDRPDAVAIALHGGEGENGSVQAVLEMLGVPFVGTPAPACRRAWDKPTAKAELARAGLCTPDWVALPHTRSATLGAQAVLDAMVDRLGLPLMLKPDQGGSALGAHLVTDRSELPAAMVGCLAYARHRPGRAVRRRHRGRDRGGARRRRAARAAAGGDRGGGRQLRLLGALHAGRRHLHLPGPAGAAVLKALEEAALAAHQLLGLRDVSRTDAIVDASGQVQILEVNVSPGLTETSLLPIAARTVGSCELGELYAALVERAVSRETRAQRRRATCST